MKLPKEYKNVWLTYHTKEGEEVTRRAFYSCSDGFYNTQDTWIDTPQGFFNVPQYWQEYTQNDGTVDLLPYTFNHYPRVYPNQVISWKYAE